MNIFIIKFRNTSVFLNFLVKQEIRGVQIRMKVSIVIPVYYNEENLRPLYDDIKEKIIGIIDYEYEIGRAHV